MLTAPGGLQVLRASASATTELKPGDAIFLGDRLQNDGANSVWIGLNDGTAIYIGRGHRLTIDGTICDALGHLTDGALETKRPGVKIIAQIPSPSGADWTHHVARGGSGMMAIAAFTVALIEELQARNDDLTTLLDDSMSYQGLGSIYEVVTNEAVPRVLHVEPGIDLILTPRGSGLGVDLQITSAQQMLDLLNQSRDVLSMWQRGQQDAIIHKADLDNAAPTQGGTPGSGSLFPDFPPITTGPIILVNGPTSPPPPPPPPPPSPPPPPPPDPLPQQGNVPTKPVITDVSNISSPTIQDLTNDNTPTLSGAAPPGTTVTIYDNGSTVLGTAHADNTTGAWNFTVDQAHALSDGQHSFTATATDSGGHVSDPSPAVILTIDMTDPTAGTLSFANLDDTGHADSPPITQDGTFDLSLSGDTDANGVDSVVYQQNLNGAGWTDLTGSSLSGLADGSYQFHAVVTDNAGNSSTTNTTSVIVDNTAPGLTITETDQSGGNFLFTFTFSEGVFDFVQGNHGITVTNGTASTFSGADGSSSYTLLVTPGAGTVSVSVANGAASDAAGNLSAVASYSMADPNDNDSQGLGTNDSLGSSSSHQSQVLYGGAGNDTLSGGQAADTLYGGSGNDVINGDNGGDVIYGGSGNDTINGGVGSDTIIGGYGADQLTGGQGANVFMYLSTRDSTPAQPDTIMDFDASNEKIVFYDSGFAAQGQVIDADSTLAGLQHFTTVTNTQTIQAHNINWYYDANLLQPDGVTHGETVIQADTDGNTATAEMEIHLVGQVTLTAANFVLA